MKSIASQLVRDMSECLEGITPDNIADMYNNCQSFHPK